MHLITRIDDVNAGDQVHSMYPEYREIWLPAFRQISIAPAGASGRGLLFYNRNPVVITVAKDDMKKIVSFAIPFRQFTTFYDEAQNAGVYSQKSWMDETRKYFRCSLDGFVHNYYHI